MIQRVLFRLCAPAMFVLVAGCATLNSFGKKDHGAEQIWTNGQDALSRIEFEAAETAFTRLVDEYPNTPEGRESLFYLGVLRLDPRNTLFDTRIAEDWFTAYLDRSTRGERVYRFPEAEVFFEIAHELNLPPDSRVAVLQPVERVITIEEQVLVPTEESRELTMRINRLRTQVAERDSTIKAQQDELERIRRTLTGGRP
ncbi:MAG: tetratricopeptide repeat protein [Gemmatimonadota bacterium]|jgi:TolA-binding protein|nr:tetratricopeptide repeat protein [Gemmatimonadota bacterium]